MPRTQGQGYEEAVATPIHLKHLDLFSPTVLPSWALSLYFGVDFEFYPVVAALRLKRTRNGQVSERAQSSMLNRHVSSFYM